MRNLIFTFRKQAILLAMLFTGIVAMAEQITVTVTTTNGLQDAITALGAPAANAITDLKVICPSNTVYLGPTAFSYINSSLTSLEKLDLSQAYTSREDATNRNDLPQNVIQNNTTIKTFIIPTWMTSLGNNIFPNTKLTSVVFHEGFTGSIGSAFVGCRDIKIAVYPTTMSTTTSLYAFGNASFRDCDGFEQHIFKGTTPPTMQTTTLNNNMAFFGANGASVKVGVPASAVATYKAAWGSAGYGIFADNQIVAFRNITFVNEATSPQTNVGIPGTTVTVQATSTNKTFDHWATANSGIIFTAPNSAETTFTMPDEDVVIIAVYQEDMIPHTIDITGGTAIVNSTEVTEASEGDVVTITATPEAQEIFLNWSITNTIVDNAENATTTFVMPAADVTISAGYRIDDLITITLTPAQPRLSDFAINKSAITKLKIVSNGQAMDNADYTVLRDEFPKLQQLDIEGISNTSIPADAFINNTSIENIVLPTGLISIGVRAFFNTALKGVINIPYGVNGPVNLDNDHFGNSISITGFTANANSTFITTVDGVVFNNDKTALYYYPCGKTDSNYTIPEGVIIIRNGAFDFNHNLKNLTIASTTNSIHQTDGNNYTAVASHSEIENIYVNNNNTFWGSTNGILYEKATNKVVWSPKGKSVLRIDKPITEIAGGGSQNNVFGGNATQTIGGIVYTNNYTSVITFVDLPATLQKINDGAFAGATNLLTVICRAENVPTAITSGNTPFRAMSGNQKLYVPALSLADYKAAWNPSFSNNNNNFIAFYNVAIDGGTASSPLASDIAAAGQTVTITATPASNQVFKQWNVISGNITLAASSSTSFVMPSNDVVIEAEYETLISWTGTTNSDWNTTSNWDSNQIPTASDNILIPSSANITLSGNGAANSITIEKGASINLGEKTLTANSINVKYGAITGEKWYSIGFPFAATVYSDTWDDNLEAYTIATGGNYWLKNYVEDEETSDYVFDYTTTITNNGGYIIQFPTDYTGSEISFISSNEDVIELNTNDLQFSSSDYQLQANPNLAPYSIDAADLDNDRVWQYNPGANEFVLITGTASIQPFEAVITKTTANPAPKITLDTDVVTGMKEKPVVVEPAIATRYYNLQGVEVAQPQRGQMYLVKTVFESGKTSISKIIRK